jgi:putative tryptophan/tyrosine transport system substrate-binding protein
MRRRDLIVLLGGTAVAWSIAARAQKAMPVIGYLMAGSPGPNAPLVAAVRQGLSETGYVEGQNLAIEFRAAEGRYDRLPTLAADLVGRKVDGIVAGNAPAALAAKSATSTIPIVFASEGDPVQLGLVASFNRPGGNITGVSVMLAELMPKRLELLSELVPHARVIALLVNPNNATSDAMVRDVERAARAMAREVQILNASNENEIDAAFVTLSQSDVGALLVGADGYFYNRREQLVSLAALHSVPAIYQWREFAVSGGLITYGASLVGIFHQIGIYVGKILNGARPTDLPVQQPTTFELVINLKTANALALTIPPMLLARADEVIE